MDTNSQNYKHYFARIPVKDWLFRKAYSVYEQDLGGSVDICGVIKKDLNDDDLKSKRGAKGKIREILEDLKFFEKYVGKSRAASPSSAGPSTVINVTGDNNDTYNSCSNITKNVFALGDKRRLDIEMNRLSWPMLSEENTPTRSYLEA
ncbi:hypothetical protein BDB00DRAFT_788639 [Zychaea mexicana]|uniref:uncharacterized protein n=1 Tax=Zychaea mexicana TaxID=64656 RepID=UPI0022FE263E|nr:uncharacterized protein BDB00DRAFT_788639 [Zychaea mexicana]KAI9492652.1 hypothetical protein BDB00DRAFT_788639 [Zychaea mexicana]